MTLEQCLLGYSRGGDRAVNTAYAVRPQSNRTRPARGSALFLSSGGVKGYLARPPFPPQESVREGRLFVLMLTSMFCPAHALPQYGSLVLYRRPLKAPVGA